MHWCAWKKPFPDREAMKAIWCSLTAFFGAARQNFNGHFIFILFLFFWKKCSHIYGSYFPFFQARASSGYDNSGREGRAFFRKIHITLFPRKLITNYELHNFISQLFCLLYKMIYRHILFYYYHQCDEKI